MKKNFIYTSSFFIAALLAGCSSTPPSKADRINLNQSLNWLTINKHRDGVQETASGLQYKIIKQTSGCKPNRATTVTVNYDMRVAITNEVVDQNYERHSPAELPLSQVIQGWKEGVMLMRVGEIWEFYIPPELAYGEKSSGDAIRPNTALTSKIWLLDAKNCKK